jgi:hypothetical protein
VARGAAAAARGERQGPDGSVIDGRPSYVVAGDR